MALEEEILYVILSTYMYTAVAAFTGLVAVCI